MGNTVLFFLLAFLSEIAGTVGGFGSSIFFVPLAQFFFDFQTVLGITALLHVFSNTAKLALFRDHFSWKLVCIIGIPSVIFVIAGALLSNLVNIKIAQLILSLFCILFSLFFLWKPAFKIAPTPGNGITGGATAGFIAGLVGTGGAIRALCLSAFALEKNVFIATSAAIDFGVDFSRSLIYFYKGYMALSNWCYLPPLIVIAFAGSYAGKKILQYVSQENFKRIVLLFVLITGIALLVKTFYE
jgi:uncharacterized membrane protein YfcA